MNLHVERIFREEMEGDTSFQEKESGLEILFGRPYSKVDMREAWHSGVKHGIFIGLQRASLEGQKIELYGNTTNPNHKEFLEKFYKLADEYGCAVHYHPEHGMTVVSQRNEYVPVPDSVIEASKNVGLDLTGGKQSEVIDLTKYGDFK